MSKLIVNFGAPISLLTAAMRPRLFPMSYQRPAVGPIRNAPPRTASTQPVFPFVPQFVCAGNDTAWAM